MDAEQLTLKRYKSLRGPITRSIVFNSTVLIWLALHYVAIQDKPEVIEENYPVFFFGEAMADYFFLRCLVVPLWLMMIALDICIMALKYKPRK